MVYIGFELGRSQAVGTVKGAGTHRNFGGSWAVEVPGGRTERGVSGRRRGMEEGRRRQIEEGGDIVA